MTLSSFTVPRPNNETDFESYCLIVFQRHLKASLQKYARRGQRQFGVDLLGNAEDGSICGVQCKLRNANDLFTEDEMLEEVVKAKAFPGRLDRYVIATSARRNPDIQRVAAQLTSEHKKVGLFTVEIYSWNDIEEIVSAHQDLLQELHGPAISTTISLSSTQLDSVIANISDSITGGVGLPVSTVDEEIDQAFEYTKKGDPAVTIVLLERLRRQRWDFLASRLKYRIIANTGNACCAQGNYTEAAQHWIDAARYQPDDKNARALEAMAHLSLNDLPKAQELATRLCEDHPDLARAHMVRIRTSPPQIPLDELERSVPEEQRSNPEVALALHHAALNRDDLDSALRHARAVHESSPDWGDATIALANILLERQKRSALIVANKGIIPREPEEVQEAVELLSQVIEALRLSDPSRSLSIGLSNRAFGYQMLADRDKARNDIAEAYHLDPEDTEVAIRFALDLADAGELDRAVDVLEGANTPLQMPRVLFVLAMLLRDRKSTGDLHQAVAILRERARHLDEHHDSERNDVIHTLIEMLCNDQEFDEASESIESSKTRLTATAVGFLNGYVKLRQGNREAAVKEAQKAAAAMDESTPRDEQRRVALLLERTGSYEPALKIWKDLVEPVFVGEDTTHLLICAEQSKDDALIMSFCAKLRSRGLHDDEILELEVRILVRYQEYDRAVDAIDDHLQQDPDDRYARLLRSQVGLVGDRNEIVETDARNLPTVEEVCSANAGLGVAQVLAHGPDPLAAAEYAYELYRRFPKEADAHSALAQVIFAPTHSEPQLGQPKFAGPGVAVVYREQDGPPQHVIIEDGPDPSFERNEIPPDDERAVSLAGCRVGESFKWNERGLQTREGKIVALVNTISFRARDCMDNWADRFPGRRGFERIRALEGSASDDAPLVKLRPFLETLRKMQQREDELIQIYDDQPIALPMLSKSLGRSVLETTGILAMTPERTIKCCGGTSTEFEAAVAAMRMTDEIVLDGTACATLFLLEVDEWVADLPFRCVVCEATLQEYRNLARGAATGREAGRVGFIDNQFFLSEMDEEQSREWAERLTDFVARIEQSCEVVGGSDLAKLDVNTRQLFQEAFRGGTAEAIAVAKTRSVPIWTDDLRIGQLCTIEYGIRRTWTQAVLLAAEDARLISTEAASDATIKLYNWGYQFTGLAGRSVGRACEIAQWDPNREPAATVLTVFSNRTFGREYVLKVLYSSVLAIWQSVAITELAEQLTIRILENLDRDPDGRMLAGTLLSNLEKLFGLDVVHAKRAERCIYAWLSIVPTRVLVP